MQLAKLRLPTGAATIGVVRDNSVAPLAAHPRETITLGEILEDRDPRSRVERLVDDRAQPIPLADVQLLPPIDRQEVWAAGVTYKRSKTARMEESTSAASLYDRV